MKTTIVSGSLGIFFALAACSPPVTTNQDAGTDAGGDASATGIGPMGGTVRDRTGLSRIEVPAGALSATVPLTLEPATDDSALPPGAVRVGFQFQIGPMGTSFAQPVRWVLPFDPTDVVGLGNAQADVKVWVRNATGWTLTEPVAVTESTVTIEVREATIAAAGVRLVPRLAACGGAGQPACVEPTVVPPAMSTCTGNFCLQVLADPATRTDTITQRIANALNITVHDGKAYWRNSSGLRAFRVDLNGGAITESAQASGGAFVSLDLGQTVAVDSAGNLWSGLFRYSFASGVAVQPANVPSGFGKQSVAGDTNPDGRVSPPEVIRAMDGSIHAYRRVFQVAGEGGAQTTTEVRMERWTFNANLSVTGPVTIAQGFSPSTVLRADPMQPGTVYAMGRLTAAGGGIIGTQTAEDGVRVLRIDNAGMVLASLTVPVVAGGLSFNAGSSTTGLCTPGQFCAVLHENSLSVRGAELIAPTHPSIGTTMSVQRMDGASPMLTRTAVNLPMALPTVINVVHDSQGGLWLFTRAANAHQLWHFNRMANTVTPIGLGMRTPFGITSDGGDGVLVIVNNSATNGGSPTGLVRVRRLMM